MKAEKLKTVKSKKNKLKALSFALVVFLLLVLICSMVFPAGGMSGYAAVSTPTVSITEYETSESVDYRIVEFSIQNAETSTTEYTIHYRTQNGSAIADENFTAVNDSITITASTAVSQRRVKVYLKDSGKTIDNYGIAEYDYSESKTISSVKTFICEIYYAESNGDTVYVRNSSNTDGTVAISSTDYRVTLSCHEPKLTLDLSFANDGSSSAEGARYYAETQWLTTSNSILWTGNCYENYEDDDITQKLAGTTLSGVTVNNMTNSQSGWTYSSNSVFGYCYVPSNNSAYFNLLGTKRYIWIYTDSHTYNKGTWGGDVVSGLYYMSFTSKNSNVTVGSLLAKGSQDQDDAYHKGNLFAFVLSTDANGNTLPTVNGYHALQLDYDSNYILMAYYKSNGYYGIDFTLKKSVHGGFAFSDNALSYMYYDTTAPSVTGYYVQPGTYGVGQTIRLSVKFDELVRLASYNSPPKLVFGSTTANSLTFEYAGGDGTDTLYFEATVKSSKSINITDLKEYGSDISVDYFN